MYCYQKQKTLKFIYALFSLISFILLLSACKENIAVSGVKYDCIRTVEWVSGKTSLTVVEKEDAIFINGANNDTLTVSYEISNVSPNQLYSFQFEANSKNGAVEDIIDISTQNIDDVNSNFLSAGINEISNNSLIIKQLFKTNRLGKCIIKATYTLSGDIEILNPVVNNIMEDDDYYVCETEKDVRIVVLSNDMEENNISKVELSELCAEVSKLRRSIKWLCSNYEPFNDVTDIIFTENNHYTALSGDPIYINRGEIELFFNKSYKSDVHITDGISILCHEVSHTFDKDIYCFDKELFATLKQIFALKENGYGIDYNYLMNTPELSSRIYNYEVVLRQIIEKLELLDNDWLIIKETLHSLESLENNFLHEEEKFNAFIMEIGNKSGINIFSKDELEFLINYYSRQ